MKSVIAIAMIAAATQAVSIKSRQSAEDCELFIMEIENGALNWAERKHENQLEKIANKMDGVVEKAEMMAQDMMDFTEDEIAAIEADVRDTWQSYRAHNLEMIEGGEFENRKQARKAARDEFRGLEIDEEAVAEFEDWFESHMEESMACMEEAHEMFVMNHEMVLSGFLDGLHGLMDDLEECAIAEEE